MKILYINEYGDALYTSTSVLLPQIQDTVVFNSVELVVKHRIFDPITDTVSIILSEVFFKKVIDTNTESGRLTKLNSALMETNKRQQELESKTKYLTEDIATIKKRFSQKDKK